MNKRTSRAILLFSLLFLSGVIYFFWKEIRTLSADFQIVSPLPRLLLSTFAKGMKANSHWEPRINSDIPVRIKKEEITADSALSYDLSTDILLYEKNIKKRLPIASLTKIMTAVVVLENERIDKRFKVGEGEASVGENSMGLSVNEVLSLEELLHGLILLSGNDAAEVIAEKSRVGREIFIYLMNKKAEDLGLSDTHFTNPTGLEGDGNQYSSAYDLLAITRYALENETFAKIVSTYELEIPETSTHKLYHLYNDTNLLTTYPGVKGVKTGFTEEAGMCLVTYLEYDDHRIIAILLNSENRREEMKQLLDYSLRSLGVNPPPHP